MSVIVKMAVEGALVEFTQWLITNGYLSEPVNAEELVGRFLTRNRSR
jgi:hypothetical protein